jgi:hypothetical protein
VTDARDYEAETRRMLGMPEDLIEAIEHFDDETRTAMLDGWERVDEDGRERYRRYIERARTRRGRTSRCRQAALQLLSPSTRYGVGWGT